MQMTSLHGRNDKDMKRYLEEHRLHVAAQIQKLKLLKVTASYVETNNLIKRFSPQEYLQCNQKSETNHLESTPMVKSNARRTDLEMFSPIMQQPDFSIIPEASNDWDDSHVKTILESPAPYSIRDISTWIGATDRPATSASSNTSTYPPSSASNLAGPRGHVREMQHDLDAVLDKLQQILANNIEGDIGEDNGNIR